MWHYRRGPLFIMIGLKRLTKPAENNIMKSDDLEVVWSGGELLPPRETKTGDLYDHSTGPDKRAWNRSGRYDHKHSWLRITVSSDGTEPYWLCAKCGKRQYSDNMPSATQ